MNTESAIQSTESTESTTAAVTAPKQRGAKRNPNSAIRRGYALYVSLSPEQRVRKTVMELFERELGVGKGVASVYFYNCKKEFEASNKDTSTTSA